MQESDVPVVRHAAMGGRTPLFSLNRQRRQAASVLHRPGATAPVDEAVAMFEEDEGRTVVCSTTDAAGSGGRPVPCAWIKGGVRSELAGVRAGQGPLGVGRAGVSVNPISAVHTTTCSCRNEGAPKRAVRRASRCCDPGPVGPYERTTTRRGSDRAVCGSSCDEAYGRGGARPTWRPSGRAARGGGLRRTTGEGGFARAVSAGCPRYSRVFVWRDRGAGWHPRCGRSR